MTNALPLLSPVLHDIHVNGVSAGGGVAGHGRVLVGRPDDRVHALAGALAEANRLLALY